MLRGALGFALKRTVCTVRVKVCEPCLLRLLRAVAAKTPVAPDLTADRGLVTLQHDGNLALVVPHFQKCLDLVRSSWVSCVSSLIAASLACRFEGH